MGMTVAAFNSTLKTFLEELTACTPPECSALPKAQLLVSAFDGLTAEHPDLLMNEFLKAVSPHVDKLMVKDPSFFDDIKFPGGVNLKQVWEANDSDATRAAVWQYLQMLFLLASATASVPGEILQKLEDVAKEYAGKVNEGSMDFASVAQMFMQGAGGLGGLGGQ